LRKATTISKAGPEPAVSQVAAAGQWDHKGAARRRAAAVATIAAIADACPCERIRVATPHSPRRKR